MHFLLPAVFSGELSTTDTESLADGPEANRAADGHGPEAKANRLAVGKARRLAVGKAHRLAVGAGSRASGPGGVG